MDETTQSRMEDTPVQTLVINRVFDTTPERLWQAWTEPDLFMRWWGPENFTSPRADIDLRVGGSYFAGMRSPEGQDFWSGGEYREILPPKRLVFTDSFMDADGNVIPAEDYGMGAGWPDELLAKLTFTELGDRKTLLTLEYEGVPEGEMRAQTEAGWNGSFDKLAKFLQE